MTVPVFANVGGGTAPDINSAVDRQIYSGSSWTPPTSGLLLCIMTTSVGAGTPSVPTLFGNNLEWYQIHTVIYGVSSSNRLTLLAANATGSAAAIMSFSFAETQLCCRASFLMASGSTVDFTQGVTGSIVQAVSATVNGGTTGTATLAAASHADNRPIFGVVHGANEATAPKTGWAELDDLAGANPIQGLETQYQQTAFDTTPNATWATSALWAVIGAEIKGLGNGGAAQNLNVSVSMSRLESVLDRANADISPLILLSQRDGVSDGMNNSISSQVSLAQRDGVSDGMSNDIPKFSALNKVLTISDAAGVGIYPALMLLQILSQTQANFVNAQGSVGLSGDLGISGDPNTNINPNASLLSHMGVSLSGGLNLLSNLTLAEKMGFSVLGNVSIYPSLTVGKDLAFVPANIALIGGSVSVGTALGLIDVPRLDAQASLAFLQALGINLSSALSTTQVEAVLALAERLGLSASAQLNSFPLVGLGERLFLLDANNASLFGTNVLNEAKGINVLGGIALQESVAIPIDLNILTSKLIAKFGDVSLQERLGISDSVFANMQASVSLGETAGMGNTVNQILNAGLSINVVGSVLTISGLTVIIVKGFVFTSDATRNPVSTQDSSKTTSSSDSGTSSVTTTMSDNYISTGDE